MAWPVLAALLLPLPAAAAEDAVRLFSVVGPRDTVFVGVPGAVLDGMGPGPDVARPARVLAHDGQVTGRRYTVQHGVNSLLLRATAPVALMRSNAVRLESFVAGMPVQPMPDTGAGR